MLEKDGKHSPRRFCFNRRRRATEYAADTERRALRDSFFFIPAPLLAALFTDFTVSVAVHPRHVRCNRLPRISLVWRPGS